jgi:exonuclease III
MNSLSWNIRGVGDAVKIARVKKMKQDLKINFIALQETLSSDWTKMRWERCWENSPMDCEGVNSSGRSGGLVCIWDKCSLKKIRAIHNQNFLLVSCQVSGSFSIINFINVYSPQDITGKRNLWNRMLNLINTLDGMWVLLGDFNEVRCVEDGKNSVFISSNARAFNDFIAQAGLLEYTMGARLFTYVSKDGAKRSKIDRFFWSVENS